MANGYETKPLDEIAGHLDAIGRAAGYGFYNEAAKRLRNLSGANKDLLERNFELRARVEEVEYRVNEEIRRRDRQKVKISGERDAARQARDTLGQRIKTLDSELCRVNTKLAEERDANAKLAEERDAARQARDGLHQRINDLETELSQAESKLRSLRSVVEKYEEISYIQDYKRRADYYRDLAEERRREAETYHHALDKAHWRMYRDEATGGEIAAAFAIFAAAFAVGGVAGFLFGLPF